MVSFNRATKLTFVTCIYYLCISHSVYAGPSDIKPTPILNLQAGISDELVVSIRNGEVNIEDLITVFEEEEQKNLGMRIDQKFTPLCAASSGRNIKAMKDLIELGADVNSLCVNNGFINNSLELVYRQFGYQDTEVEAAELLKGKGAKISDSWIEDHERQKTLMKNMAEERKKQAAENLNILAGIFGQLAMNVISQKISVGGHVDRDKLTKDLISTTRKASEESSRKDLLEQQKAEVVTIQDKISSSVHRIPFTHFTRVFFADKMSGDAWCSGTKAPEQLIGILKSLKATLVKMNRCTCAKVEAKSAASTLPYVCGIPYAYKI